MPSSIATILYKKLKKYSKGLLIINEKYSYMITHGESVQSIYLYEYCYLKPNNIFEIDTTELIYSFIRDIKVELKSKPILFDKIKFDPQIISIIFKST